MVLLIKKDIPFLHSTIVNMIITVFIVNLDYVFARHFYSSIAPNHLRVRPCRKATLINIVK